MAKTGQLFDNGIAIHQIHSLCDCNKHKRVQRYAMTRRKAVSEKIPTENIGQLPILPRPTKRTMILPSSHSPTVIIATITGKTQTKAKLPTHTEVKDIEGLDRDSIILLEQIRTIDKRRLREYMGTLDKRFLPAMDKALAISIGLNGYSQCPMKQGRFSASLPAHECCPLHDDSVQKKD